MKKQKEKIKIRGIFIILLMAASTIGFAVIESMPLQKTGETALPTTAVIGYALTDGQKYQLLANGATIMEFFYDASQDCAYCAEQKAMLESLASQFADQMVLSEISVSSSEYVELPKLVMTSKLGLLTYVNASRSDITDSFCRLVLAPPLDCALRTM